MIKLVHKSNNIDITKSLDEMSLYVSGIVDGYKLAGFQNKMYDDKEWELYTCARDQQSKDEPLTDGDLELISSFINGMRAGYKMKAEQVAQGSFPVYPPGVRGA